MRGHRLTRVVTANVTHLFAPIQEILTEFCGAYLYRKVIVLQSWILRPPSILDKPKIITTINLHALWNHVHCLCSDYDRAVELYSEALKLYPSHTCEHEIAVCCANRAACHMKKVFHPPLEHSPSLQSPMCTMSYLYAIVAVWSTSNVTHSQHHACSAVVPSVHMSCCLCPPGAGLCCETMLCYVMYNGTRSALISHAHASHELARNHSLCESHDPCPDSVNPQN